MHTAQRVESTRNSHILNNLTVYCAVVHALEEVVQVLELAALVALVHNACHSGVAHTLNTSQSEADITLGIGDKGVVTLVYIGSQYPDTHTLALIHLAYNLIHLGQISTQHSRHKLTRIVGFKVCCLVGNVGVAGSVRLVKCVRRKCLPLSPNLFTDSLVVATLHSTIDELGLHLIQHRFLLLTHRFSQGVGLTSSKACQQLTEQHHLLLIYGNAIGISQILLHLWELVCNRLLSVLTGNEVGNLLHWTRSVEGVHSNKILQTSGFQRTKVLLHTRRLELEYACRKSLTEKFVCLFIVKCYVIYINNLARCVFDVGKCIFNNRKGSQTQEVHLDKSHTLNVFALKLHNVQVGILCNGYGRKLLNIILTDNHTASVNTRLTHRAFEFLSICESLLHKFATLLALLGEFGYLLIYPLKGTLTLGRSELVGD